MSAKLEFIKPNAVCGIYRKPRNGACLELNKVFARIGKEYPAAGKALEGLDELLDAELEVFE